MEDNNKKEVLTEEQKEKLVEMYNKYFNVLPEAVRINIECIIISFGQLMSIKLDTEEENELFLTLERQIDNLKTYHLEEFKRILKELHEESKEEENND
jgi:hypothetical protein